MCRNPDQLILLRRLAVRAWVGSTSIARSGLRDLGALTCAWTLTHPLQLRHATFTPPLITASSKENIPC